MARPLLIFLMVLVWGALWQGSAFSQSVDLERGPVRLADLVAAARQANPDLAAARQRYAAALRVPDQAGTLEDPRISFAYSPKPTQTRAGPMDYKLGIEQMFPVYGVLGLREEAARHMADSVGAQARESEFDLVRDVQLVFFDWLYTRRALEINEINRSLLVQFRRIAEQRYRAGLAPQSDPLKAAVALAKIDAQEATFVRMEEVAKGLLNVLLNRDPGAALGQPEAPPLIVRAFDRQPLAEAALKARPELAGARKRIASEAAQVGLARKDYWPGFTLGVEWAPMESGTNPGFAEDGQDMFSASLGMNLPIQLGRRNAALTESREREAAAESDLIALSNRVLFEVHERHARFREARRILDLYRKDIVPAAGLELETTRKAYENARVDFLNLLDSERSYEEILLEEAAALRNYQQELVWLERTVGMDLQGLVPGANSITPNEDVR